MEFTSKKLPLTAAPNMRVCPVESVQPFVPLPAPLYVLMNSNEKFLAVKGPLDFFTPQELSRLKPFENLFYPPFIRQILPFRSAARSLLGLLQGIPMAEGLRPAPFELSDAFLRLVAPLLSSDAQVEPFFIVSFITELCGAYPGELAETVRESNQDHYEQCVLKSSWAAWQALHLDYLNLQWLKTFRNRVFQYCAMGEDPAGLDSFSEWIKEIHDGEMHHLPMDLSALSVGTTKAKLEFREERLRSQLVVSNFSGASTHGETGLLMEAAG